MRLSVLGTITVERDGEVCDLGSPKQRALLARLVLDVGSPVSVDRLVDDLWHGAPPARAIASLQAYVSNLRRVLEPERPARTPPSVLITQPPGYALRVPPESVDAVRFATLVSEAGQHLDAGDVGRAHEAATQALAMWRGPALADLADEPFAAAEAARLEELRLVVEETRLAAALHLGRHAEAVVELERLVAAEPLRERLWELLVLGLYRAGRTADALDRYQRVRALLGAELGLDPGPGLRALEEAVLRQDPSLLPGPAVLRGPPQGASGLSRTPTDPGGDGHPHPAVPGLDRAGRPPLVGREVELAALTRLLADAAAGRTRWALLTGPAGMGKSRLAEAVRDRASQDGWTVASAACHDDADTPPHWVWRQLLRALPDAGDDPIGALGARDRFALSDGIERLLTEAAALAPLLLVIDDLQWADPDSLRVLRYLAVQLRDPRIAIVATVRDHEETPTLAEVRATLERQPGTQHLALAPLADEAVADIIHALAGSPPDADQLRRLQERSGGNAYFATELARLPGGGHDQLPAGVREAVLRRIARLPTDVRGVLALAAVAGQHFDVTVLAAALDQPLGDLLDLLDPAVATAVLTEEGGARFAFAHGLLRDALLADLAPAQRRRLHARVANALGTRPDPGDRRLAELAHHLIEAGPAGDLGAAVDAAARASEKALARLAYDDAARWAARALGALDQQDTADLVRRHGLLIALGQARYLAGSAPEARAELAEAIDVAVALGDLDAVGRAVAALCDTGGVWLWADFGQVPSTIIERLEAALPVVGPEPTAARARLLLALSAGLYYGGDEAQVAALSDQALEVARQLEDPAALVDVLLARANLRWTAETYAEAVALADEALALPDLSTLQQVVGHTRRAVPLIASGRLAEGNAAFGIATAIAQRSNLIGPLMQLAQHPIARALAEGRIDDAETLVAGAWALRERGDVPIVAESIRLVEVLIERERGELAPLVEVLEGLVPVLPLRSTHLFLALAHLERGDEAAARAALTASSSGLEAPWMRLFGDTVEAEVRAGLPADDAAAALATRLTPHAHLVATAGTAYWWGPVGLSLALLEARLGRLARAEERLGEVAERADAWGTTAWAVRARAHLECLGERAAQP